MSELPTNWISVPLELLGSWGSGGTPPKGNRAYYDGDIPWAVIGDLSDGPLTSTSNRISALGLANSSAKIIPPETVLIAMYGSIGKLAITKIECSTNQAIAFCRTDEKLVEKKYFFHALRWTRPELIKLGQGASQQNISQTILKAFEVPFAPLAEQTRIAQKLDGLLAQVDTLKARIDAIPALFKRFRQSVLTAAVSGRLTEEWRKENVDTVQWTDEAIKARVQSERLALGFKQVKINEIKVTPRVEAPQNWVWLKLSEISLKITDGAHNTPKITGQGFPYVTAKDLTGGHLDFTEKKFISEDDHRELYKKCRPSCGDLLIVNIGAGTGNNALVNVDFEFSFKNVAIIKRSSLINPQYLKAFFDSRKETIFNEQTQGGAQPFLSLTMLGNIEIVLPPPEEQTEIVRRVEQLFAFADQLEAKVASAKSRIDHLTQSILAKAFCGELVPQDPNDEPASVLLERIKAQRAAAPKAKRGRKNA